MHMSLTCYPACVRSRGYYVIMLCDYSGTMQGGCPISEVIFYTVCVREYFRLVLCWEVCLLSDCPLLEVHCNATQLLAPNHFMFVFWPTPDHYYMSRGDFLYSLCTRVLSACPLLGDLSSFGLSFIRGSL